MESGPWVVIVMPRGAARGMTRGKQMNGTTEKVHGASKGAADTGPDKVIRERVRSILDQENIPSLRQLEIEVDRRALVISGKVPTFYAKQLVRKRCRELSGEMPVTMNVDVA